MTLYKRLGVYLALLATFTSFVAVLISLGLLPGSVGFVAVYAAGYVLGRSFGNIGAGW